tara:strand:- start:62 stop:247 length:186 start_codon:yes stop_codon:yes gene_type:complete
MKLEKWKALIFMQITLASNFIILGYILSDEPEYKNIIISASIIGALACTYEALRIYKKNKN